MNADFWPRLFLGILVIIGIWNAFGPGMIFGKAGDFLDSILPKYATKPLFECPPCMASVHGSWVWLVTGGALAWLPVFIVALSGAMKLVTLTFLDK